MNLNFSVLNHIIAQHPDGPKTKQRPRLLNIPGDALQGHIPSCCCPGGFTVCHALYSRFPASTFSCLSGMFAVLGCCLLWTHLDRPEHRRDNAQSPFEPTRGPSQASLTTRGLRPPEQPLLLLSPYLWPVPYPFAPGSFPLIQCEPSCYLPR